jgi:DNA-binding LytR/AlgR family response regulator
MKPIAYDRFMKAIGRATNTIIEEDSSEKVNFANQFLFFKVGGNFQRIMLKNISYLEAFGNYTKLYEGNNMILISEGISGVYQKLPQEYFVRIHKSYVVNLSAIATVQTQHIIVNNRFLPLGETFKQSFHTAWGKFI